MPTATNTRATLYISITYLLCDGTNVLRFYFFFNCLNVKTLKTRANLIQHLKKKKIYTEFIVA